MRITLAQWSLHRAIQSGELRGLDFPRIARELFSIDGVEIVNTLLESFDVSALDGLRRLADGEGVDILLAMIDDEGDLAAASRRERSAAVEGHRRWIERAARLGCRALRVNTGGESVRFDSPLDVLETVEALDRCSESLATLCEEAAAARLDVLLENHGGLSSNAPAVVELLRRVDHPALGTLPDFGNCPEGCDRYATVETLLPYARAVSAKCHDFDAHGDEPTMDWPRLVRAVVESGFDGTIGIEYEGERLDERAGIRAARRLLERLLAELVDHRSDGSRSP